MVTPTVRVDASDYGLGGGRPDVSVDDAGARRGITEAEARARLDELAASRAAREPKTVLPLSGELTTCYCERWGQMHFGLDIAAPLGTPIYSATDGVVLEAGAVSGFGNAVYIQDEDGNVHIYGHMRYYSVEAGQLVHAGDQIATVGNEGFSTGPHLHYEIHRPAGTVPRPTLRSGSRRARRERLPAEPLGSGRLPSNAAPSRRERRQHQRTRSGEHQRGQHDPALARPPPVRVRPASASTTASAADWTPKNTTGASSTAIGIQTTGADRRSSRAATPLAPTSMSATPAT